MTSLSLISMLFGSYLLLIRDIKRVLLISLIYVPIGILAIYSLRSFTYWIGYYPKHVFHYYFTTIIPASLTLAAMGVAWLTNICSNHNSYSVLGGFSVKVLKPFFCWLIIAFTYFETFHLFNWIFQTVKYPMFQALDIQLTQGESHYWTFMTSPISFLFAYTFSAFLYSRFLHVIVSEYSFEKRPVTHDTLPYQRWKIIIAIPMALLPLLVIGHIAILVANNNSFLLDDDLIAVKHFVLKYASVALYVFCGFYLYAISIWYINFMGKTQKIF